MMEGARCIQFQWNLQPQFRLCKNGSFVIHRTPARPPSEFSIFCYSPPSLFFILHIHLNRYVRLLPPVNGRRCWSSGCQAGSENRRDFEALWSWNEQAEGDRFEGKTAGGVGGGGGKRRRSAAEIGGGR